ncbi:hypothetical protein X975_14359, partial [Stegodyphus mimosarum]
MKENGLSLSMASLYSDADIHKVPFHQKEIDNKKYDLYIFLIMNFLFLSNIKLNFSLFLFNL